MAAGSSSPCAACKLLRRRCAKDCIFAPYFPPDEPQKFAIVHRVFGASNASKMLQELPVHHRADAVSSLVFEANARIKDPVYGCVGAISYLQNQVSQLQMQLALAEAESFCIQMQQDQFSCSTLAAQQDHSSPTEVNKCYPSSMHDSVAGINPQLMNFSSPSNGVIQEPREREFLWTQTVDFCPVHCNEAYINK